MVSTKTIAITLACLARVAAAEDRSTTLLTGHVTDTKTGVPIENAQVHVSDAAGHERVAPTDRTGRYALDVAPGAYDVTVEFGTSRARGHVSIEPGQSAVLDAQVERHPSQSLTGHITDTLTGMPVEHAQVYVSNAAGPVRVVTTDRTGRYAIDLAPGTYDVTIQLETSRAQAHLLIEPGQAMILDSQVESTPGEVIEIHDPLPPKVMPKPTNFSRTRAPPYSQEALDKDAWARAWMLLDIGPDGAVKRFKFLKRPGYDLEKIAAAEVFKLRFEPARNDDDKPMGTSIVWGIEWPSAGWLEAIIGTRSRMPSMHGFPPRGQTDYVPCKGSGPMNLGSVHPTYRDCSGPDLSRVGTEAWIVKP